MQEVGGTKWSLATVILAIHGLHMLSCSRGTLPLNVLDVHLLTFWPSIDRFTLHDSFSKVKLECLLAFLRIASLYHLI